ncbi:MAG: hypothetical protein QOF19_1160 [Alphaproteobacteria bacterium]|jgi:hypothetical protein|nr:hypothetical protein [Alphaproteobacteria bacterium]
MRSKKSQTFSFETNRDYQGVYFLKIDAAGHSSIVARNTTDIVERFFDAFESSVRAEVDEARKLNGCMYSQFWGWAGDGGLCVIYDAQEESRALKTAIESACNILTRKLAPLRETLKKLNANGDFKIRAAVHKGTMRYTDFDRQGSIHSKDLNFVAHLEVATPYDTVTISRDIFEQCPIEIQRRFYELPFEFESRKTFAFSERPARDVTMDWVTKIPISDSKAISFLSRRYSESEKSQIISGANFEVVDLGTALSTCSHYLVSGKRPSYYRNAVISVLERGIRYVCLVLNPDSDVAKQYAEQRNEADLLTKTVGSIENLSHFSARVDNPLFEVWLYSALPHFAAIAIDRKQNGLLIYAPYLPNLGPKDIARADTPHMLLRNSAIEPFSAQADSYIDYLLADKATVRAI